MTRMFRYFVLDMMCFWMIITDTRSTIVLQVPDTGLRCHTEEQLQCTIDSLPSSTTLTWIKGNSPIAECSPNCIAYANAPVRYTFSNTGNTTYTFVITNVTADDQDIYECSLSTSVVDTKQLDVASPLSPEHVFVQYSESTDETATVSTSTGCITNSPGTFTYFAYDNASGTTKTFNNYTNISTTPLDCDAAQYCNLPSVKNTTDIIKISKSHQKGKYLLRVGIGHLFIDTNVSIDIPEQCSADQILCDNVCMVKCDCPVYKNTSECKGPWCAELDNECIAGILGILAGICFVVVCITLIVARFDPKDAECCCSQTVRLSLPTRAALPDKHRNEVHAENTELENQPTNKDGMGNRDRSPSIELRDSRYRSRNH